LGCNQASIADDLQLLIQKRDIRQKATREQTPTTLEDSLISKLKFLRKVNWIVSSLSKEIGQKVASFVGKPEKKKQKNGKQPEIFKTNTKFITFERKNKRCSYQEL